MRTWYNASNGNHYNLDVVEPATIRQQFTGSTDIINVLKPVSIAVIYAISARFEVTFVSWLFNCLLSI
jgi:hypothetical protein